MGKTWARRTATDTANTPPYGHMMHDARVVGPRVALDAHREVVAHRT